MKYLASFVIALFTLVPLAASAHQHAVLTIGGTDYEFTVGSLNEPIAVDDKTGVDFRVTMVGHEEMAADDHHAAGGAVTGLEETMQVELIAGDQKKVLELSPVYNTPGAYSAKFYPTVATTLSYRFFGTVNGTPVDITFTCRTEGAEAADEGEKALGDGVTQKSRTGGFGCPAEKEPLGFPEKAPSVNQLSADASGARTMGMTGLGLGAAALALAFVRRRA